MPPTKKKAIALLTTAAGLGIVLVAGVMLYRPLEERYWLWKLREGDESEKERAADRLAELGVEEAIPILISQLPQDESIYPFLDGSPPLTELPSSMRALTRMGALAVPHLSDALSEKSDVPLFCAVYTLGGIGPAAKSAIPALEAGISRKRQPSALMVVLTWRVLKRIDPDNQAAEKIYPALEAQSAHIVR